MLLWWYGTYFSWNNIFPIDVYNLFAKVVSKKYLNKYSYWQKFCIKTYKVSYNKNFIIFLNKKIYAIPSGYISNENTFLQKQNVNYSSATIYTIT